MFVTLSFRSYAQLIRELEGLDSSVTDAELSVRLDHYSRRIWDHLLNFGIRLLGLAESTPDVAAFRVDISGATARDGYSGINRDLLLGGLNFLRPIAVTVEETDLEDFTTGPVLTAMADAWEQYASSLQRLPVDELFPTLDRACQKWAWSPRVEYDPPTGVPELDAQFQYDMDTAQLQRAGLEDPMAPYWEAEAYRQAEIAAETARQEAAHERIWGNRR